MNACSFCHEEKPDVVIGRKSVNPGYQHPWPICEACWTAPVASLNADAWLRIERTLKTLTSLTRPVASYMAADKSRQTPSGQRISNAIISAWSDLSFVVARVKAENWLDRQLSTLEVSDEGGA